MTKFIAYQDMHCYYPAEADMHQFNAPGAGFFPSLFAVANTAEECLAKFENILIKYGYMTEKRAATINKKLMKKLKTEVDVNVWRVSYTSQNKSYIRYDPIHNRSEITISYYLAKAID